MDEITFNGFMDELTIIKEAQRRPQRTAVIGPGRQPIIMHGQAARQWTQRAQKRSREMPIQGAQRGTLAGAGAGAGIGALAARGASTLMKASPLTRAIGTVAGAGAGLLGGGAIGGRMGATRADKAARSANIEDAMQVSRSQRRFR